ncbi:beta strand repeat-containing protein [Paenibacillus hexagrammi]|uniref:DUF11 domain-containing protein n=1 Tax=Paenibacillus hexagrammi TaxID=2908839 RepID=A0ABY3SP15_9BACL|nr:hypothetical protein [Paenibacillus sp. YPD9-1]UJF35798.1 hypothetical protein L0M14_12340 [Paenibacillus sp. YPD9-1]
MDQATAAYTYRPPDGRTISASATSNSVTIPVTLPSVTLSKSSSLPDASVGDVLTYSFAVTNTGLSEVNQVRLIDALPTGSSFVSGSVTVNGAARSSDAPSSGISVGTISSGTTVNVSFQVQITSVPSPAQLSNQASLTYSSGTFNGVALSNNVTTPIYQPVIGISKSANTTTAVVGDTYQYQFSVTNSGNIASTVTITDSPPSGTSFVEGSVTVNGTAVPGASPIAGISAGSIAAGATATVTFSVTLNGLPSPPVLTNKAQGTYTYQLPSGRTKSGSVSSNSLNIPASAPNVSVSKSASSADATVGDVLTYSINMTNNGVATVTHVVLSDSVPSGAVFIEGSLTLRGVTQPSANPASLPIGIIHGSETVPVTFQVRIAQVPSSSELDNQAVVTFRSGAFLGTVYSNPTATTILQPVFQIVKTANTTATTLGSALAYTVQVKNVGNAPANITLSDPIPAGATFITNSVIVNGSPVPQVAPDTGIPIGTLAPGSTATVSFGVTVSSLPTPQWLTNQATAAYTFTLSDGRSVTRSSTSNTLEIPISVPMVSLDLSDQVTAVITGDTITYTAAITNTGASSVNNVVLSTMLDAGTAFVPGSVTVNGSPAPTTDPVSGIPIGSLAPGATATVTYEVRIEMPTTNQITNQSTVSFTSGTFSGSSTSNTVVTPVTQPEISLVKSASTQIATVGNNVVYSVVVSNTGNLPANVTLTDTIPGATAFVPNSVVVGGMPQPDASPATGIPVGTVNPGSSVTVSFALVINTLPTPQTIMNQASATYTFTPPDGRLLNGTAVSNTVTVNVSTPNVGVVKNVNTDVAVVGDTLTYSTTVTNAGIDPIQNVVVLDAPPAGTTFVPGTVTVNGVLQPDANPSNGIPLGTIAAGSSGSIAFNVRIPSSLALVSLRTSRTQPSPPGLSPA